MHTWQVQDAKARFSEFLEAALKMGPQIVTRRGIETAILIPIEEWRSLRKSSRPSLKQLLLVADSPVDLFLRPRGASRRRHPETR